MIEKNTKMRLLEHGLAVIQKNGFNNTGIQEVLSAVGVPKGSFYHYFKSKHDFGMQILDLYAEHVRASFQAQLEQAGEPPLERLRGLFEHNIDACRENAYTGGCLISNLSNELGDVCPVFRERLAEIWDECVAHIVKCLSEARDAGALSQDIDVAQLGNFLFNSWHGALVRMKVTASDAPLRVFMDSVFPTLLGGVNAVKTECIA